MQKPCGALALAALLVAVPMLPAGAQDGDDGSLPSPELPDALVPGTGRADLLHGTPRTWSLEARADDEPRRPVLTGRPDDPARGVVAAQIFTDLAAIEAAFVRQQDDGSGRLQPVFNVGTLLSTLRFDPPFTLEDGGRLETIDAPRLDWGPPGWENLTGQDPENDAQHMRTHLSMQAAIPHPDANGTSPPPGGTAQEDRRDGSADPGTGLRLVWQTTVTNRSVPFPLAGFSPAAIRFTWTLEGPNNTTFTEDQRLRWVFLYDYDIVRTVERPEPRSMMDGAYLVSGDHRAALRLARLHHPLDPHEEDGPIRSTPVELDVRPSAGGDGPDTEGRPMPSPLVLEAHTQEVGHPTRGYTYSGELRFYEAASPQDDGDDGGNGAPNGQGPGVHPVVPRIWQAVLVVGLALLLIVPWRRRPTPSTTP